MALISNNIVVLAKQYVGKKELPNNSGFTDPEFQKAMEDVGWKKGYSWCVYFVKMIWKKSLQNDAVRDLAMKLINGNSQVTLKNFVNDKSGYFTLSDKATPGAIVIWQTYEGGQPKSTGHAGIVTAVGPDYFDTVEGNTNSTGGREGIEVANKRRSYKWNVTDGLRLRKFITIRNA